MKKRRETPLVERYIERLETKRRELSSQVTRNDLEDIARETGFSEMEIEALREECRGKTERGQAFLRRRFWDEAILELEGSYELDPFDAAIPAALAEGYKGRFLLKGSLNDRDRALSFARTALERDAGLKDLYDLIRDVENARTLSSDLEGRRIRRLTFLWAGLFVLIIAGLSVVLLLIGCGNAVPRPSSPRTRPGPASTLEADSTSFVPSIFLDTSSFPDLELAVHRSISVPEESVGGATYRWDFNGALRCAGSTFRTLVLRFEGIGSGGSILFSTYIAVVPPASSFFRAGQTLPLLLSVEAGAERPVSVRWMVVEAESASTGSLTSIVESRPAVVWDAELPCFPGLSFRVLDPRHYRLPGASSWACELLGVNGSPSVLVRLVLRVIVFDGDGGLIAQGDAVIVPEWRSAMYPGERRSVPVELPVPESVAVSRVVLRVVEAR